MHRYDVDMVAENTSVPAHHRHNGRMGLSDVVCLNDDHDDVIPMTNGGDSVVCPANISSSTRGDVAKERKLEERMRELGLLDTKKSLERMVVEKLDKHMEQTDDLTASLSRRHRRRRPLRDHVASTACEIQNAIRSDIVTNEAGLRVYKVSILMGHFTRNVQHTVCDNEVLVTSTTVNQSTTKLSKETRVEFPQSVDMGALDVCYKAGVFKMQVPFKRQSSRCQSMTTSCDRAATLSVSSDRTWSDSSGYDTKSDVSAQSVTMDSDEERTHST